MILGIHRYNEEDHIGKKKRASFKLEKRNMAMPFPAEENQRLNKEMFLERGKWKRRHALWVLK